LEGEKQKSAPHGIRMACYMIMPQSMFRLHPITFAITAAVLFGASTPFAKLLLHHLSSVMLAGLLYLGAGIGLGAWTLFQIRRGPGRREARISGRELPWLGAVVLCGGILGPLLLLWGLERTTSSVASLLLNLEGVFTAFLAWFIFRENFDWRIAIGMLCILVGGVVMSWGASPDLSVASLAGPLAIAGACLCWGMDNNLTRKLSRFDPVQIAAIKGVIAGLTNTVIAMAIGATLPPVRIALLAGGLGFASYGVSLVLFILGLRHLGTARTGAYFSLAPFVGAALSIVFLDESLTWPFVVAGALMGVGLWLHFTERHYHEHLHPYLEHEHRHDHDDHHQHDHLLGMDPRGPHSHQHAQPASVHVHAHYPDIHHQHSHERPDRE
jgi:drug/metabolite transporter (DMT)-like permease